VDAGTLLTMSRPPDLEARVLAGGADRDVEQIRGEIRDFKQATTASFNAMREDINDLRGQMNNGFAEMRNGFAEVDRGFIEMRGRLDATAAGIEQIARMLERGQGDR
jgi:methyl-accepting chemotaxis protein